MLALYACYNHSPFDNEKYGNNLLAFCFTAENNWIGSENGLLKMDPNSGKIVKFFEKGKELPDDVVTALYSTGTKELWIGTSETALVKLM
jgi:ligand-binding sensor domain-containing protein